MAHWKTQSCGGCWGIPPPRGEAQRWLVRWGSICHTNGARAYTNLAWFPVSSTPNSLEERLINSAQRLIVVNRSIEQWPGESEEDQEARIQVELAEEFNTSRRTREFAEKFRGQRYAASHVIHKPKKMQGRQVRRCFVALRRVRLHDSRVVWVKAGTEGIDGEWAGVRRCVSRCPITTVKPDLLQRNLRVYQWKRWHTAAIDKLPLLGRALKRGREIQRGLGDLPFDSVQQAINLRTLLRQSRAERWQLHRGDREGVRHGQEDSDRIVWWRR